MINVGILVSWLALGNLVQGTMPHLAPSPWSAEAILFYHANIIDVRQGQVVADQAILIDRGEIQQIGNYTDLRELISVEKHLDVGNRFVIPGLWDMHIHLEGQDLVEDNRALLPVFLAYGITTVRDMASDLGEQVLAWRDTIHAGRLLGPQIFTAGRKLEGVNSIWKGDLEIANEQELQEMLDKLEAYQVDLVKITENTLSGPLFLKSVQEARQRGFLVSGHVPVDLSIFDLARAGFSSIEHASYLLRLGGQEKRTAHEVTQGKLSVAEANTYYASHFDQKRATRAYQKLARMKVAVTPTLIGGVQLAYLDETDHGQDEFLQYLSERFVSRYAWRIERMANEAEADRLRRKDRAALIAQQLPYLQNAGVLLLAGSDAAALNTYVYPAQSLHQELLLWQEAGLAPSDILRGATLNGAQFMNQEAILGTIEIGKQADLVILNSNPLVNIKATQDIFGVVNNGHYFGRKALDELLAEAARQKKTLDFIRQTNPK